MYSSRFIKLLYLHVTLSHFWGGCSFKFCPENREFYMTSKGKWLSAFTLVQVSSYTGIFLPLQIYRHRGPEHFEQFNFAVILCIACLMGATVLLFNFFRAEGFCHLCNGALRFMEDYQSTYTKETFDQDKSKRNYILDAVVVVLLIFGNGIGIIVASHYVLYPRAICYFTSELPENNLFNPIFLAFCLVVFSSGSMSVCSLLGLLSSVCTAYYFIIVPVYAEELIFSYKREKQKKYLTFSILRRNVDHLTFVYRQVEILHNTLIRLGGILIVPLQITATKLVLFCNLMLIRNLSALSSLVLLLLVSISFLAGFGWSFFLKMTGSFYKRSVTTLDTWKRRGRYMLSKRDAKYLSKFRKSCRPLRVGFGKTYTIKPVSVLNFLKGISRGTFRIVLASKK